MGAPWRATINRGDFDESGNEALCICGICGGRRHYVPLPVGDRQTGFCPACRPWAAVALDRGHLAGLNSERAVIYARSVRARRRPEGGGAEKGPEPATPFRLPVEKSAEQYPQAAPQSPGADAFSAPRRRNLVPRTFPPRRGRACGLATAVRGSDAGSAVGRRWRSIFLTEPGPALNCPTLSGTVRRPRSRARTARRRKSKEGC